MPTSLETLVMARPAFQLARWCKYQVMNAGGRLLDDLASSLNSVLGTGRVCGNNGQASFVGSPGQEVASRPGHVLMCSAFKKKFFQLPVCRSRHVSDHCTMSLCFVVEDAGMLADWSQSAGHRRAPGAVVSALLSAGGRIGLQLMWQS